MDARDKTNFEKTTEIECRIAAKLQSFQFDTGKYECTNTPPEKDRGHREGELWEFTDTRNPDDLDCDLRFYVRPHPFGAGQQVVVSFTNDMSVQYNFEGIDDAVSKLRGVMDGLFLRHEATIER